MDTLLNGLRAIAEPTRLRILALCAGGELTVTELCQILGQSQPRVSRHLKLLVEADVLERHREGSWVFYRAGSRLANSALARAVMELLPEEDDTVTRDRERLRAVMTARAERAQEYFRDNAEQWDSIRRLHVDDTEVAAALLRVIGDRRDFDLLDIGTGTGRVLEVLSDRFRTATGVDASPEMLSVARTNIDRLGLSNCHVRMADMYQLPFQGESFDVIVIHMVLHFAEDPAAAIKEAARVLTKGGRIIIADFLPHHVDALRDEHAHRRLGFSHEEIEGWMQAAGLTLGTPVELNGDPLTVCLWSGEKKAQANTHQNAA